MSASKKTATMPKWQQSPDALVRLFEQVMQSVPTASTRKVFGFPAAFVNGQMFAGLHQDHMILRLSEGDREQFLRLPGAMVFEPMAGRPMREYVVVPAPLIQVGAELQAWIDKALAYATSLPPKTAKSNPATKRSASRRKP